MSTVALILAIAYLPGAMVFRLPVLDRSKRAALPAEERLFWAVMVSVIISSTVAFALASVGAYTLGRLVTVNVVLTIVLAGVSAGDLRLGSASPRPNWTAALPAGLIALGAWMYFAVPASEYVLGGRDPGVYMNEGIQIAQRQALMTIDPVAAAVPASARDIFFPMHGQDG